jgi:hypothetical protein
MRAGRYRSFFQEHYKATTNCHLPIAVLPVQRSISNTASQSIKMNGPNWAFDNRPNLKPKPMHQARLSKFFQPKGGTPVGVGSPKGLVSKCVAVVDCTADDVITTTSATTDNDLSNRTFDVDCSKRARLHDLLFASGVENDNDDDGDCDPPQPQSSSGKATSPTFTPLEKQVVAIRQQYPDSLLMVECGYRMRFFGADAIAAAKVLSIMSRADHNFVVASVPTYRAFVHCQRLLAAGYKVAIVRQTETAAIRKGNKASTSSTFERSVAGVFTEGNIVVAWSISNLVHFLRLFMLC